MNRKISKFIHSRLFIIVLIGILMLTTLLVGTYAWFTWSSTDTNQGDTVFTMNVGNIADVFFTNGNTIDGSLNPVFNYTDGLSTSFRIDTRSEPSNSDKYYINFNITSIDDKLISEDVKYVVVKDDEIVSEGDLSTASGGSTIKLYTTNFVKGKVNYDIYIYIDGNAENDPDMMNKSIVGNITVAIYHGPKLKDYIYNLYSSNISCSKCTEKYTNNTISFDQTNLLVNDMLDSAGVFTNDEYEGNLRYVGKTPSNYILFNCDTYPNTNCETWRIMGVMDGKVKIMRNTPIGIYSFDSKGANIGTSSGTGSSNWTDSRLQMLLNPVTNEQLYDSNGNLLYNETPSLYWNAGSGKCYLGSNNAVVDCSFSNTNNNTTPGLKNSDTRDMVSDSIWYLNAPTATSTSSNMNGFSTYKEERTGTSIWNGKIGLINPSDYLLAYVYVGSKIYIPDWLHQIFSVTNSSYATISVYRANSSSASSATNIWAYRGMNFRSTLVNSSFYVVPVLYLEPNLTMVEGTDGSSDNPFQLAG